MKQFIAENQSIKVICHFIGSSGRSRDLMVLLRRCVTELREEYLQDGKWRTFVFPLLLHIFGTQIISEFSVLTLFFQTNRPWICEETPQSVFLSSYALKLEKIGCSLEFLLPFRNSFSSSRLFTILTHYLPWSLYEKCLLRMCSLLYCCCHFLTGFQMYYCCHWRQTSELIEPLINNALYRFNSNTFISHHFILCLSSFVQT